MLEKHGVMPNPTWSLFRPICSTVMPPAACLPMARPLYSLYGGLLGMRPGPSGLPSSLPFPPMTLHNLNMAAQTVSMAQHHHHQHAKELQHSSSSPNSTPTPTPTPGGAPSPSGGSGGRSEGPHYPLAVYRYHPYSLAAMDKFKASPAETVSVDSTRL
ncbi:hypothetical protein BaRGS_00033933 [Batillaria attramentaria]|uniref:Uncharacterized protein n=1 Tax=Batillaria attramentaria TaxID=370345 RepID=A0ABD0JJ21_9CAEN